MKWVGPPQVAVYVPANSRAFCIILLSLNTFGKPSATMIIAVFFLYFNIFYRFPFGYCIFFVILER